jgi:hypothetical protein
LFNPKSKLLWKGSFNAASSDDHGLIGPARVGLDEKINVYATDPGNRRIVVFDSSGKVLLKIPASRSGWKFTDGPTALAVADGRAKWSYFHEEKAVFCADRNGTRIWKIGFDGSLRTVVSLPPGHMADYAAVDYFHNFWVTDTRNHCVLKFDHNLRLLDIFGSYGDNDNQFIEPRGIAIYKRYGQTFIAEKNGAQYFWVGTQLKHASLVKKEGGWYSLIVKTTEYSFVSIYSVEKNDTVTYIKRNWVPCDSAVVNFIVKDKSGIRENGLTLKVEPTYSSYSYNTWCYPIKLDATR